MPEVVVTKLDPAAKLPSYATDGDAGADLSALVAVKLPAGGGRALVPTGIAIALPPGTAGFVQPRSGLALKHGVTVLNSPGLIDAGYRGEVKVLVANTDPRTAVTLARGDRVAQLVVQRIEEVQLTEVDELPPSERGTGGFGSTGA